MKKLTIEIEDDVYEKIKELTEFGNLANKYIYKDNPIDYLAKEFVVGSVLYRIDDIEHFKAINPLMKYEVTGNFEIKNRFKEIALRKGISIKEIAEQLDVATSHISTIFNNHSQPRMEMFIKIWIILGCPKMQNCLYVV